MNRFIVAGAPCAGKSSYVRENARPGDLVYDYDTLHQALSGQADHQHLDTIRPYVLAARDAVFGELAAHGQQPAWVITSTRKTAELEDLAGQFGAEIVFLEVGQAEAHRRATAAQRPEAWHGYIDDWFAETDIAISAAASAPKKRKQAMKMKQKTFRAPLALKADGEEGEFEAIFATLNVEDHDGDVTTPGAFEVGQEVVIEPWNHGWDLPAGKGAIVADGERAWVEGQFFMDTDAGMQNYRTVKNLGGLVEWSYTFDIKDSGPGEFEGRDVTFLRALDVVGVGPVTRGAGIGTQTTAIKRQKDTDGEAGDQADAARSDDPSTGSGGDSSTSSGSDGGGKPDPDLLTRISITEANVIRLRSD